MSCGGNRFACGIRRFDKHKLEPNRPSNQELHNENESRLSELLRMRDQQDQAFFPATAPSTSSAATPPTTLTTRTAAPTAVTYTPWVTRTESSQ